MSTDTPTTPDGGTEHDDHWLVDWPWWIDIEQRLREATDPVERLAVYRQAVDACHEALVLLRARRDDDVRAARRAGLTTHRLAQLAGVTDSYVSRITKPGRGTRPD